MCTARFLALLQREWERHNGTELEALQGGLVDIPIQWTLRAAQVGRRTVLEKEPEINQGTYLWGWRWRVEVRQIEAWICIGWIHTQKYHLYLVILIY